MGKFGRFLIFCCAVAAIVFIFIWYQENHSSSASNTHAKAASQDPNNFQEIYRIDRAGLDRAVEEVIDANPRLDIGVAIIDLQTHQTYHYGETASFDGASIGKLITATALLHKVEMNKLYLNDRIGDKTVEELLKAMIVDSDNDAWTKLNTNLTKPELNRYAHMLGLESYMAEDNTLTADNIALLIAKFAEQKLLNAEHNSLLLSLMKDADMRNFIVKAVPDGVNVYHKGGYLDDRLHDAAIIQKGDRSYVLVVFSKSLTGKYDYIKGSQVFGAITKATLKTFLGI